MHKAATGALQAQAVDRLGNLHLHFTGQAKLLGGELVQAGCLGKPLAEHEAAVPEQNLFTLGIDPGKVALVDGAVLVDEAMVRGHQQVVGVGTGQLLDQPNQLLQGFFHCLENPLLGFPLVAGGVDAVVVDVDHVMVAHQRPAVITLHGHQLVGLTGGSPLTDCLAKDLDAVGRSLGTLAIHQHGAGFVVGNCQCLVGQQRRHAELGVAGQHRKGRFQFGAVAVFLADQTQQLIADFVAHGIGDDHADLVVLAKERPYPVLEKLLLLAHGECFPLRCRIHEGLETVAQLQQVVVGVEVFDLLGQTAHQRRLSRHAHMVGELAVELIELIPEAAVALHAFGQAVHGELSLAQGMGKLGGVIDRFV